MISTVEMPWQSTCKRGHVEHRRGLYWDYVGAAHVCTQFSLEDAVKIVQRKLDATDIWPTPAPQHNEG